MARTFGGDQNEESTKRVVGTKENITPAEHIISADLIKSVSSMQSADSTTSAWKSPNHKHSSVRMINWHSLCNTCNWLDLPYCNILN